MKLKIATLAFIGGVLASSSFAGEANPAVEAIIAQIDARRAEKTAAEVAAAQDRSKQMEERGGNGGMRPQQGGGMRQQGARGNRKPGGNNQDQGK